MTLFALSILLAVPQVSGGGFDRERTEVGDAAGDLMGAVLGSLADVDGDGVDEYLASAFAADFGGLTNAGLVRVWSGASGALLWEAQGLADYDEFGIALATVEDLDGDGRQDLAVGLGRGEVQLLSGATGGLIRVLPAPAGAGDFGEALAAAGDLNGDLVPDLFVGAGDSSLGGQFDQGAVYAIDGLTGAELWRVDGEGRLDHFGRAVLSIPDRDGDGLAECVAAAPLGDAGGVDDVGVVRILAGSTGAELARFEGGSFRAEFGSALGLAGDHDGDGIVDLIVGAPRDQPAQTPEVGTASVYSGADDSLIRRYPGAEAGEWMGAAVASAGDLDEDGIDEVMIGANGAFYGGRVYHYSGRNGRRLWISESDGFGGDFAAAVHPLGDFDGDGDLDHLIGAPHRRDLGVDVGAVSLWSFKPFLTADATSVSDAVGGVVRLFVDFPERSWVFDPAVSYWTLVSLAGTGPSILLGWEVPLGSDSAYDDSLAGNWPTVLRQPQGRLDAQGDAVVTLDLPPGVLSGLIGRTLHFSVMHYEGGGSTLLVHGASRPVLIDVLP
ncbi:MAG: VCBS repeat-containing protein [Planctomycetota bacterium]|jgi:hypothetical protein